LQERDDVGSREAEEDVMHDLDRAMFEKGMGNETEYGYEAAQLEHEEFLNVLGEVLGESDGGPRQGSRGTIEHRAPGSSSQSSARNEAEEMELALELLQVRNEEELEGFFSTVINTAKGALGAARDFAKTPVGGALKDIGTAAVGGAIPAVGTTVGGALGRWGWPEDAKSEDWGKGWGKAVGGAAKSLLGWELEGLSQEDREFEAARTVVRWAKDAAERAAEMAPRATPRPSAAGGPARPVPPAQIAKAAAVAAAQRVAPGLAAVVRQIPVSNAPADGPGEQSGRWVRRGNTVVLHGF
jgi:hypothetical protein